MIEDDREYIFFSLYGSPLRRKFACFDRQRATDQRAFTLPRRVARFPFTNP